MRPKHHMWDNEPARVGFDPDEGPPAPHEWIDDGTCVLCGRTAAQCNAQRCPCRAYKPWMSGPQEPCETCHIRAECAWCGDGSDPGEVPE